MAFINFHSRSNLFYELQVRLIYFSSLQYSVSRLNMSKLVSEIFFFPNTYTLIEAVKAEGKAIPFRDAQLPVAGPFDFTLTT